MGLGTLFDFIQEQMRYVLYIIMFIAITYTAFKRAWIAMIGVILGLAFFAIFIDKPEILSSLGIWMNKMINIGG